jgi:hypothetical protein
MTHFYRSTKNITFNIIHVHLKFWFECRQGCVHNCTDVVFYIVFVVVVLISAVSLLFLPNAELFKAKQEAEVRVTRLAQWVIDSFGQFFANYRSM